MNSPGGKDAGNQSRSILELDRDSLQKLAEKDDISDKTWTRVVVEKYLSKFRWYYPSRKDGPSLSDAYAFYEHVTLPRHFVGNDDRAEPGESEEQTRLYSFFTTSSKTFIEWGIGIDSYFSSLKMLSAILFIAGLINIPNMLYFASEDYSANGQVNEVGSLTLIGSAVCTTFQWSVCRDCLADDFSHDDEEKARFGITPDGTILVEENACHGAEFKHGMVNYVTFLFLFVSMTLMSWFLNQREVRSDEDKLTATDYSLVVRNPPPTAFDPDEWKTFFQKVTEHQVTAVTVALNNDEMLRKLTNRRVLLNSLQVKLPRGINMDDDEEVIQAVRELTREEELETSAFTRNVVNPVLEMAGLIVPAQTLLNSIQKLTQEIRELQKIQYKVCAVYVTFETEEGQRKALQALTVRQLDVWNNNVGAVPADIVFQDRVLFVEEPAETDSIRWMDLGSTYFYRLGMWAFSLFVTLFSVAVSGVCVSATRNAYGPYMAGMLVSVFNSIIPTIVSILMENEPHLSEDSYECSLFVKITLFRWINTAVLVKLITPVTGNLAGGEEDILPSINAILVSELYVTPILNLMDISSNINKHIYAPRARTQREMNRYFVGTFYNIGERLTSLTNILFVCFFYGALFPATFFFGAAILLIQHYVDKFSLMRLWSLRPAVGAQIARFSRRYFFNLSLLAFILTSSYAYAQYPYDNLCDPASATTGHAREYENVKLLNGTVVDSIAVSRDTDVQYCSQSWRDSDVFPFPPTSSRLEPEDAFYMTDSQRKLVDTYGWTALVAVVAYFVFVFGSDVLSSVLSFFRGQYSPTGSPQYVDFSSNVEISGYVPQIRLATLPFPLLACDVDSFDKGLIGWTDKERDYDHHNMIFDVPWKSMKRTRNGKELRPEASTDASEPTETDSLVAQKNPIFSVVKHYPPLWMRRIDDPSMEVAETEENGNGHGNGHADGNGNGHANANGNGHGMEPNGSNESWWNPLDVFSSSKSKQV